MLTRAFTRKLLTAVTVLYCVGLVGYAFNHTRDGQSAEVPSTKNASDKTAATPTPPPPKPLTTGTEAPDFSLNGLDGKTYTLKQFRGKPVLLEIFASWCPHCQNSVQYLNTLQQEEAGKLKILAINGGDRAGSASTAIAFRDAFKVHYTILDFPPLSLLKMYHVYGIPQLYIIDKNGLVSWSHAGELNPPVVKDIKAVLNGKRPHQK